MHDQARPTRILRGTTGVSQWEMAVRLPRPALRAYIRDYCGYEERAAGRVPRLEFPGPQVVVVVEFGPPVRVYETGQRQRFTCYPGGFVAGLDDRFTLVEHDGVQRGVQFNLTPIGARLFFDRPMSDLARQVVSLGDLLGVEGRHLADRLQSLPGWDARFDLVEDLIEARLARARRRPQSETVAWAWCEIERRGGAVDIRRLARQLGYSQKHVIALFRDHLGFPPKLLARIVRFDRLMDHLRHGGQGTWAELALCFGYYDQSHLVRDVQQFAGSTPTAARVSLADLSMLHATVESALGA
jgi:AraC-like DNA-binding protein